MIEQTTLDVWKEFNHRLRLFIKRRISDTADVDDILQDVFLKIHSKLNSLQDKDRLSAWLYQVTRNTITDFYRTRRQSVQLPEQIADKDESIENEKVSQLAVGVRYMIFLLPEKYREALILTEIQGLSQQEMAKRLGLSLAGAKSRVQRGRRLLKDTLLDCCHFEFDQRGRVMDYYQRADHCAKCECKDVQLN